MSFKTVKMKTNTAARYDRTIVICFTQYIFSVMEPGVSSNCTRNIPRPSTPKEVVNRKEDSVGQTRRQIRKFTHAQIEILAKFYSIT